MKKLLLVPILAVLVAGCASVPSTKVSLDPKTGVFTLDSPKEITISNLVTKLPDGIEVKLVGYQSHNSPDVIAAVANANAQMADKLIQAMQLLQQMAAQGALKGATGGIAP
jgi:PBP1b-binding outer membrane lipoprotein LpoB